MSRWNFEHRLDLAAVLSALPTAAMSPSDELALLIEEQEADLSLGSRARSRGNDWFGDLDRDLPVLLEDPSLFDRINET